MFVKSFVALAICLGAVFLVFSGAPTWAQEDKLRELMRSPGYIEIKLQEAHVPDLDPLPGQGDSDVMARVYQVITPNVAPADQAKQNYTGQKKELICETQIIQDDNHPKFDKKCITLKQVPGDAVIRIELTDSDKPAPEPDWIGAAMIRVADVIINRKLDSSEAWPIDGLDYPKYYLKAKVDIKRND